MSQKKPRKVRHPSSGKVRRQIAAQIVARRNELNLTQAEVGARIGVSQQQIAKLESGRVNPRIKTLGKVADALEAELDIKFTLQAAA